MSGWIFNTVGVIVVVGLLVFSFLAFVFSQYRKVLRQAKNYERGLKMVSMQIHIPPASEDKEATGRDERDLVDEVLSKAQILYDIIASTYQKGFKHDKIYGQRHISFEIIAEKGAVQYMAVVPAVLTETIRQAFASAYPAATIKEVVDKNIFSQAGKIVGVVGGEFNLKKDFAYPIATYKESKRDVMRALLNALSAVKNDEGAAIQILFRPAQSSWVKTAVAEADSIKKNKGESSKGPKLFFGTKELLRVLWKPPEASETKPEDKQLTALEQSVVEAIEEKSRYAGYETLIRLVVSSSDVTKSQTILKNLISAFSLFESANNNGFKFTPAKDVEELVTAYIFRFFPQSANKDILNSIELATIYHLPDGSNIPTSQVERERAKQVDGPSSVLSEGLLIGYNEFRGARKEIRISDKDRNRHIYFIGQTGTGKSVLLENMAYQDMVAGRGFAFVDPHGDSSEALLGMVPENRVDDIIYFDPGNMDYPVGLNMFEYDTPDQKDYLVQEAVSMLYSLYDPTHSGIVGPRFEHIFRNCALLLMSDPNGGTFVDIPRLLVDEGFRNEKLARVTDQMVLDFWTKEFPASQRSNDAGEVTSWFVSKFGPFIGNDAMRNIIGQTKSGFDFRQIMDNKKILLVNLSKGKMGDYNSKLLGIIFVMKFQAAAMSRANTPESERVDFSLYVDEFQNFATDSFATILSEARKYKLSLILANQFMTQLTEEIREAVIGNVGTLMAGRLGITDAEILEKRFRPVFNVDDLRDLPNYKTITSALINGVPSSPFNMALIPKMVDPNKELQEAVKKLSATKYGRPRAQVEEEIKERLGMGDSGQVASVSPTPAVSAGANDSPSLPGSIAINQAPGSPVAEEAKMNSFLDEWLANRKQQKANTGVGANKTQFTKEDESAKPAPKEQASSRVLPPQSDKLVAEASDKGRGQESSDEMVFRVR